MRLYAPLKRCFSQCLSSSNSNSRTRPEASTGRRTLPSRRNAAINESSSSASLRLPMGGDSIGFLFGLYLMILV